MNRYSIVFALTLLSQIGISQNLRKIEPCCDSAISHSPLKSFTGLTGIALLEAETKPKHSFLKNYYGIDPENKEGEITGILKLNSLVGLDSIENICSRLTEMTTNVYTFSVPIGKLAALNRQTGIAYISLSRKTEPQLNNARHDAGVDKVHLGQGLPMPYTGKGVITGLVDIGIDYTHPAFKNDAGDSSRILKVWAQNLKKGTKPALYNYGSEFVGETEINQVKYDSIDGMHGTIVMGSMASGGFGSNGKYKGAAPESKIIAITSSRDETSILDAAHYFFSETKKLGKRGVFNISWGSQIGPHDGTSQFDHVIDSMVAGGNIVVGAAGNWAASNNHIKHITTTDTLTTNVLAVQSDTVNYAIIDIWGKPNSSFQVQLKAIDKVTGQVTYSSAKFRTTTTRQNGFQVLFGKDTSIFYVINTSKDPNNSRPNSFVAFLHNHETTGKNIALSIYTGANNEVHAWHAQNGWFTNTTEKGFVMPKYIVSDRQSSIGELGGTSKSIITVGAHVSHYQYTNWKGDKIYIPSDSGTITPFSSVGPTLDGRTKPDLAAPGSLAIPANSFTFDPNGSEAFRVLAGSPFTTEGKTFYWVNDDATSFAAPFVTGSIALLLEANPALTFQQIKDALLKNTTVDSFTGTIPTAGSNVWGFGKLNVYKAISSLLGVTGLDNSETSLDKFWCSNPVSESMYLFDSKLNLQNGVLFVFDMLGNQVQDQLFPSNKEGGFLTFKTPNLKSGQYIGVLKRDDGTSKTFKISKIQ